MKILNPYRFCRGGGGKKNDKVPSLIPPKPQDVKKSISVAEIVDLLCEGPIYGLVDQFGKKIYGLDMLKGIYLNKVPVMNDDGKYNFRNVVMEINLGTENQKPLANFAHVFIYKPANFKLLGPVNVPRDQKQGGSTDTRDGGDFTSWALGYPTDVRDPFTFVHHIKNKDVRKIRISLIIEALSDTVDKGGGHNENGRLGTSENAEVKIAVTHGIEGTKKATTKEYSIFGTVTSPYAYMLGEPVSQSTRTGSGALSSQGGFTQTASATPIPSGRNVGTPAGSAIQFVQPLPSSIKLS
ncbi:MAG: hypothetical protein FJX80_00235 [Bacteroidetes bacterium]|nr:hypothetical protein [Bacteroidota bacterium]